MRSACATALLLCALLPAMSLADPLVPKPESRERENYLLHCSGCHGRDGRGVPGTTPSLHELAPLLARDGGRAYLARVPGVAQAALADAELAKLLNWVLAEFSNVTPTPRYAAAEVASLRANPIRDTVAARKRLSTTLD